MPEQAMDWILIFLKPYICVSLIASYGLAQNLEGIGLFGYLNNVYEPGIPYPILNFSPMAGVSLIAIMLSLLFIVMSLLFIRGAFVLGPASGKTSIAFVLLPGVLSLMNVAPDVTRFGPAEFQLNAGYLGGVWCSGINFILAFIAGWSVVLIVANMFKNPKFKHAYDHLWCLLSLVGCLYLVVDSQTRSDKEHMIQVNKQIGDDLQFYKTRYGALNTLCRTNSHFAESNLEVCRRANEVFTILSLNMAGNKPETRRYGDAWLRSVVSRVDAERLNAELCVLPAVESFCEGIPVEIMADKNDFDRQILIPLPEHNERMQKLYTSLNTWVEKVKVEETYENYKYFLFCMIAFLAGGKAATASISMIGESNMQSRSWALKIARVFFSKSGFLLGVLACSGRRFYKFFGRCKYTSRRMLISLLQRAFQRMD